MNKIIVALLVIVFSAPLAPGVATQPSAPPTMEQLQAKFDGGDYSGTLQGVAQALSLGGKAGEGYDKFQLWSLRGETNLRMRQAEPAALAFHQASKQPGDKHQVATAQATEMLIRRSKQFQYTPVVVAKGQKATPFDVIEPGSRKAALAALYADEAAVVEPNLTSAASATGLPPIGRAVKAVQSHNLEVLDVAVNGNNDRTRKSVEPLRAQSEKLVTEALDALSKRVSEISANAHRYVAKVSSGSAGGVQSGPRGLQGTDSMDLYSIARSATTIAGAIQEIVAPIADKNESDALIAKANAVRDKALAANKADYGR